MRKKAYHRIGYVKGKKEGKGYFCEVYVPKVGVVHKTKCYSDKNKARLSAIKWSDIDKKYELY